MGYYVLSPITISHGGVASHYAPGSRVVDASIASMLVLSGASLWPDTDPNVAALALLAAKAAARGAGDQELTQIMQARAAVTSMSVPDPAALALSEDSVGGVSRMVDCFKQPFVLDKLSPATPDNVTIVAAMTGGNWIRLVVAAPHWSAQYNWDVDAVNGDDKNPGIAGSGLPIKTVAEADRRLALLNIGTPYVLNCLSDIPSTDQFRLLSGVSSTGAGVPIVTLKGTRTVLATGTFSAMTATNTTTGVVVHGTDVATNWTTYIGRNVIMTSGAASGAIAEVVEDLTSGVAEFTEWVSQTTGAPTAVPSASDTYQIISETKFAAPIQGIDLTIAEKITLTYQNLEINTASLFPNGTALSFLCCRFTVGVGAPSQVFLGDGQFTLTACAIYFPTLTKFVGSVSTFVAFLGGGAVNAKFDVNRTGSLRFTNYSMNRSLIETFVSGIGLHFPGGGIVVTGAVGLNVSRSPADGILLQRGTQMVVNGPLHGRLNSGYGYNSPDRAHMCVLSTVTPTITGASGDFQLDGRARHYQELELHSGVLEDAVTIDCGVAGSGAGWADWAAAVVLNTSGFGRNVMSHRMGSSITSYS